MRYIQRKGRTGIILLLSALLAQAGLRAQAQGPAGPAGLDQILKEISSFDGGIDSQAFWKLRDYVYSRKDNPSARAECESRLLEFLGAKATPVARMAACRLLRVIGSERSVPVLQSMLADNDTADMALYALQEIPGDAVDRALIQAIARTDGATKTALIASLGERRCRAAVPALASLLKPEGEFSGPAALALGEIGGDAAAAALETGFAGASAGLKRTTALSLLKCAEQSLAGKNERAALGIFNRLLADAALPAPVRQAAMIGRISASGSGASAAIMNQLRSADAPFQEAAILKIKDVIKPADIGPVCKVLPGLSGPAQVKLLAVLTSYPKEFVLPSVQQAARSEQELVRIAALEALGTVGDASNVPFLAATAAKSRGAEQTAARNALGALSGRAVDDAVLRLLAGNPAEDLQAELLLASANRRIYAAKNSAAAAMSSPAPTVRSQAARTLRVIGTPSDIPGVLGILLKADDDVERSEAETTIVALSQKIANPEGRSAMVRTQLELEKDPAGRARMYLLLSRIGDDSALPLLRDALKERNETVVDAAVRGLSSWPTPAALDDAAILARKAGNETHRLLALQGFLRMTGLERNRNPEAVIADLRQAYLLAARPEEKRLVLGLLPRFPCTEALDLAGIILGDPTVKAEAQAAVDRIKARMSGK